MKSTYLSNKQLDLRYGGAVFTPPATIYLARLVAQAWVATRAFATNVFICEGDRVFRATSGGTSGGTIPNFAGVADGGTIVDGSITWTEQTLVLRAGIPSGLECSSSAYVRQAITNNATNFPPSTAGSKTLATRVVYPTETNDAGRTVGFATFDALTGGNLLEIAYSTQKKDFLAYDRCEIPENTLTFSEA